MSRPHIWYCTLVSKSCHGLTYGTALLSQSHVTASHMVLHSCLKVMSRPHIWYCTLVSKSCHSLTHGTALLSQSHVTASHMVLHSCLKVMSQPHIWYCTLVSNSCHSLTHSTALLSQSHVTASHMVLHSCLKVMSRPHIWFCIFISKSCLRLSLHNFDPILRKPGPSLQNTPQPLYNTVRYNAVLDITRISAGPQMVIKDSFSYITIQFTLFITRFG